MAIGQGSNPLLPSTVSDLGLNGRGNVKAGRQDQPGAGYAGGDIVTDAAIVISAIAKRAAKASTKT